MPLAFEINWNEKDSFIWNASKMHSNSQARATTHKTTKKSAITKFFLIAWKIRIILRLVCLISSNYNQNSNRFPIHHRRLLSSWFSRKTLRILCLCWREKDHKYWVNSIFDCKFVNSISIFKSLPPLSTAIFFSTLEASKSFNELPKTLTWSSHNFSWVNLQTQQSWLWFTTSNYYFLH